MRGRRGWTWLALSLLAPLGGACDGSFGDPSDASLLDGALGAVDARTIELDAGPIDRDDAGTPIDPLDGAATGPDGGALPLDAGTPPPDAGPSCSEARTTDGASDINHGFRHYRPHYGARAEGHASCSYYWSTQLPDWTYRSSWGTGCHTTRYYYLESSITSRAGWTQAVIEAFKNWDIPSLCTPHWVRTTNSAAAHVAIGAADRSPCAGPGTGWYACAWSGWSIILNTAQSWGVGVAGRLDVESVTTVELAHVMHFAHSPDPRDSVSLANVGRWGSATMSVPSADTCGFSAYTACVPGNGCAYEACRAASDGGCGNYRTLRPGDFALAEHLAGRNASPPHPYDDGSVPADATHHDLAMLRGAGTMDDTTTLWSWSGAASSFGLDPASERWEVVGFPLERVANRMVAGDLDEDGRDDIATVSERCDGGARIHVWRATGSGFDYRGDAGSLDLDGIDLGQVANRVAAGDFDADGDDDIALAEQTGGTAMGIRVALGGDADALVDDGTWWTVDRGYDLGRAGDRFVAGDFDGDGDDDLAMAYQYDDGTFRFHVWRSDRSSFVYAGATGWYTSGPFTLSRVGGRMVAGDVDRDGDDDIAMFYGSGGASYLHVWTAGGGRFVHQASPWSVDSGYPLANVGDRMAMADFDRDGRADVATAYQYGDGTFRYHVWLSTGTGMSYRGAGGWYTSGGFGLDAVGGRLVAGNFD